jgi:hypothetical protein
MGLPLLSSLVPHVYTDLPGKVAAKFQKFHRGFYGNFSGKSMKTALFSLSVQKKDRVLPGRLLW